VWSYQLCVLTTGGVSDVLQGGYGVVEPPSSERTATFGRDNVRGSVRDGIRVDERQHQ